MYYYLIYTSKPKVPVTLDVLEDITETSIANNKKRKVTGMLLGIQQKFIQFLEGEEKDVVEIYNKICQDSRHHEINKWLQGYENERVFKDWSMGSWMLSNEVLENLSALQDIQAFMQDPINDQLQSKRFISMMHELLKTWIAHEPERAYRLSNS